MDSRDTNKKPVRKLFFPEEQSDNIQDAEGFNSDTVAPTTPQKKTKQTPKSAQSSTPSTSSGSFNSVNTPTSATSSGSSAFSPVNTNFPNSSARLFKTKKIS